MKISVVLPVFNDKRVGRALDSILSQQHDHELDLVVVDAGSTDGTLDIIKTYEDRIAVLISEPDRGHIRRCQQGHRQDFRRRR